MRYENEIESLNKIKLKDLPKPINGRDPKKLVKSTIHLLQNIGTSKEINQEILNRLIQLHKDADILSEQISSKGKIEIIKLNKITLKVLRENILKDSEIVEQAIKILEKTYNHENSSFRITGHEDKEILGNSDGLREFAVELLKVSTGKISEINEDWFENDRNDFPIRITLNYYDKSNNYKEYKSTWKDNLFVFGCALIGILILASCLIGFVFIVKWIFKI